MMMQLAVPLAGLNYHDEDLKLSFLIIKMIITKDAASGNHMRARRTASSIRIFLGILSPVAVQKSEQNVL
jgi:hypothetical protein